MFATEDIPSDGMLLSELGGFHLLRVKTIRIKYFLLTIDEDIILYLD